MAHMSKRFNFDSFDQLIAEALDPLDHELTDARMAEEDRLREEEEAWAEHDAPHDDRVPGAIGSVVCRPSFLPEPPEAEVVDLNANVVDLFPPDGAA